MKYVLFITVFFLSYQSNSQKHNVLDWINTNAIQIEDANPNSELLIFNNHIPEKFAGAKIFGFGEASHHGKEFFEIKAKFFKYLVQTKKVKVFIMEESYPAESGINEWISGGAGDIKTIANNFSIPVWYTKEIVELLEWMRNYNIKHPEGEQIRFFGMDIQYVKNSNQKIRDFVKSRKIPISEELLSIADTCANKQIDYKKETDWAAIHISSLRKIERILLDYKSNIKDAYDQEWNSIRRAISYLISYTNYIQYHKSQERDVAMFENVKWIVQNETSNGKAFIWAHNEHINNKELASYGSGWISLGAHLKEYYKEDYYSVGFDFGMGVLPGVLVKKGKPAGWRYYEMDKPFRNTYAKTLFDAVGDIYFIDIKQALESEASNFFSTKNKQLGLGGPGYNPRKYYLITKKYSEMFDGLIFVKRVSVPNYNLKD